MTQIRMSHVTHIPYTVGVPECFTSAQRDIVRDAASSQVASILGQHTEVILAKMRRYDCVLPRLYEIFMSVSRLDVVRDAASFQVDSILGQHLGVMLAKMNK